MKHFAFCKNYQFKAKMQSLVTANKVSVSGTFLHIHIYHHLAKQQPNLTLNI